METRMPKLFVAVDLPPEVTAELADLQPPRMTGIRLARPNQMHLTLHFIGSANLERTATALHNVVVAPFPIAFEGVGQFPSSGGATTLWAGVQPGAELLELHAAVATALAAQGFRPEARPYTPHVTLARCGPKVATRVVEDFLARHWSFSLPAIPIVSFGLYSTVSIRDVPVYRREQIFPLRPTARE
jgi:2'-5' RNA ligase